MAAIRTDLDQKGEMWEPETEPQLLRSKEKDSGALTGQGKGMWRKETGKYGWRFIWDHFEETSSQHHPRLRSAGYPSNPTLIGRMGSKSCESGTQVNAGDLFAQGYPKPAIIFPSFIFC